MKELDEKIVSILDTLSRVLESLRRGTGKKHKLTSTQLKILNFLENRKEGAKNADLAKHLNLTRSTISIVTSTLLRKRLIRAYKDRVDSRSLRFKLTTEGEKILKNGRWETSLKRAIENLTYPQKVTLYWILFNLLDSLREVSGFNNLNMCSNCVYFDHETIYCKSYEKPLGKEGVKIFCPDFLGTF